MKPPEWTVRLTFKKWWMYLVPSCWINKWRCEGYFEAQKIMLADEYDRAFRLIDSIMSEADEKEQTLN